ncbi:unnamed protein product [Ophioblennius macclurei]
MPGTHLPVDSSKSEASRMANRLAPENPRRSRLTRLARLTGQLADAGGEASDGRLARDDAALTEQQLGLRQAEERLRRDHIHRLVKRCAEFPSFQYVCSLCSVHIENVQLAHKHIKEKRHKKNLAEKQEENELRAITPPTPAQLAALDAVVMETAHRHGVSDDDVAERAEAVRRMDDIIRMHLPACSLRLYGSSSTRFAFKTSDVNIDINFPDNMTQPEVLIRVLEILKNAPEFSNVESDFHAKVPVVFCHHASSGLLCKVSAGNDVACLTTNHLAALAKLEPRLIPLVLAFRYWGRLVHLDCPSEGGLPSYSLALMVVFFLQQREPPLLPVYLDYRVPGFHVKRADEFHLTGICADFFVRWERRTPSSENRDNRENRTENQSEVESPEGLIPLCWSQSIQASVGLLWLELLRFFSLEFPLEDSVISVRLKEPLPREAKNWPRRRLAIEDPFSLKRNVARSLNSQMVFEYLQDRLRAAYRYFARPQRPGTRTRITENAESSGNQEVNPAQSSENSEVILAESSGNQEARTPELSENQEIMFAESSENQEVIFEERLGNQETRLDENQEVRSHESLQNNEVNQEVSLAEPSLNQEVQSLELSQSQEIRTLRSLTKKEVNQEVKPAESLENQQVRPCKNQELRLPESSENQKVNQEVRLPKASENQEVPSENQEVKYVFDKLILTGGKPPTVVCSVCKRDGHLKDDCPEDFKRTELQKLPEKNPEFYRILDAVCTTCYLELCLTPVEQQRREQILSGLERFIRKEFNDKARLCLFGSSKNGFGFRDSDLDICMTLEGHHNAEKLNCKEIIEGLAKVLKKHAGLRNILPITTAKVPIVKFEHRQSGLEGDVSLYNTLAQHNTRMLATYAALDPRVQLLGYTMKVFAKRCDIGDASRGSLSSYAYILMVLYFLQQRSPPVIPVLQEIFDGEAAPQRTVDGWNAFFYDDLPKLRVRGASAAANSESVGELWLGLLRFYTEDFDFKEHVVSIRQHRRLTTFEKQWTSKCIAIEDPFDLNHNLGAGVSRKMTNFIMKALINGRKLFGTPFFPIPGTEVDYFFDSKVLTDGELAPNDRCCRVCGKIGHYMKDCPRRRRMKKKESERDEDLKEDEPRERRCFQCGDAGHVRRDCPEYRQLKHRNATSTTGDAERSGKTRSNSEPSETPPSPQPAPQLPPHLPQQLPPQLPLSLLGFRGQFRPPLPPLPPPSWPLNDPSIIFAQPAAGGGRSYRMPRPPVGSFQPGKNFLGPGAAVPLLPHVRHHINFIQQKK